MLDHYMAKSKAMQQSMTAHARSWRSGGHLQLRDCAGLSQGRPRSLAQRPRTRRWGLLRVATTTQHAQRRDATSSRQTLSAAPRHPCWHRRARPMRSKVRTRLVRLPPAQCRRGQPGQEGRTSRLARTRQVCAGSNGAWCVLNAASPAADSHSPHNNGLSGRVRADPVPNRGGPAGRHRHVGSSCRGGWAHAAQPVN